VSILIDGVNKKTCAPTTFTTTTSCIYKWNLGKVASGQHTITANAVDGSSNSANATITVSK